MNLHAIVSGAIGRVNPLVPIVMQKSSGYSTSGSGKRTPLYFDPVVVLAQVQALAAEDLSAIDGLNIQGEKRAVYINGRSDGVLRPDRKGGDIITIPSGAQNNFVGIMTSDQMLVDDVLNGEIEVGQTIFGSGVLPGTIVIKDLTGGGGAGAYNISPSQTVPGPLLFSYDSIENWLNVHVLEYWPDWCKFVITRQD